MSEVNKSDWDVASNPIIGYADSYRLMVRMADAEGKPRTVEMFSVITDLERNIAPLFTAAQSELTRIQKISDNYYALCVEGNQQLAALREELRIANEYCDSEQALMQSKLTAAEQRNAELTQALERGKLWVELFRSWFGDYGVSAEDHQMIIRTLRSLPHPPSEFDKPTESGASE